MQDRSYPNFMYVFKLLKLYNRWYSSSSIAITQSSYLNHHLNSFLSTNKVDCKTLLTIHSYIVTTGHAQNKFFAAKLISSYASLNQPHSSTKVFDSLCWTDTFLWNSVIKAHFSNGNYSQALELFSKMFAFGTLPDHFTLPMVISAYAELKLLSVGMCFHGLVSKLNLLKWNSAIGSSFVYMYSKCGVVEDASLVFDEIPMKDVVSWTALVIGYVQNGEGEKGLEYLCKVHRLGGESERLNARTLEGGFQACAELSALIEGRCLHGLAVKSGIECSSVIQSAILSMYSKCGSVVDARISFNAVMDKDLYAWTSLISIYARLGLVRECLDLFFQMQVDGVLPDGMLISCLVSGFSNISNVHLGKAFHGFILRRSYETDPVVPNALLSMYCKLGQLSLAEKIFDGSFDRHNEEKSWNLMIVGYEKAGLEMNCISLFKEMQHRGIESESDSLISVISSCSRLEAIHPGRSIHCHIIKFLLFENVFLVNSLINLYGKCRSLKAARILFHQTSQLEIATWNSMISSYVHTGNYSEALTFFDNMVEKGLIPNPTTLCIAVSACAHSANVEKGRKIHKYIREKDFSQIVSLATALVDMYGKCGEMEMAREIFDSINGKDIISWNVMISCYGMHGLGKSALEIFRQMELSYDVRPNGLTFLVVLSACVHAGLVEEGEFVFFNKMKEHTVIPELKHYACMVDLLGRCGRLDDAEALILSMPIVPDSGIWGSLLTACKMHNNIEMGIKIVKRAIEADPDNDGYYIVMSDLYSSVGMWDDVERLRNIMKDRGVKKTLGWSTV